MKILFLTGREFDYQRNVFLYNLLKDFGDVVVLNHKIDKLSGKSILRRTLLLISLALLTKVSTYDLFFVGFYGQLLVILLKYFTSRPILFDVFLSTYDTMCYDRLLFPPQSFLGQLFYWVDKQSCEWANSVLLDTPQHIEYFKNTFGLNHKNFYSIPVGCDENLFFPRGNRNESIEENFTVLSYSTYLPLHGMDVIIRAAHKLENDHEIKFNLLGSGQEYKKIKEYAENYNLKNVNFYPPVRINKLPDFIENSSVVLGCHFGSFAKAQRVIPGKIYQALAMQRPVIASDTPANRGFLTHRVNAILVPLNDPDSLVEAILSLKKDKNLAKEISLRGRKLFQERCSVQANIPLMGSILKNMGF